MRSSDGSPSIPDNAEAAVDIGLEAAGVVH